MGTRGRDIALWFFFLAFIGLVVGRLLGHPSQSFVYTTLITGVFSLTYYPNELVARRRSRQKGLKYVVLLKMWPWWAKCIIKISGARVNYQNIKGAFEVHVVAPKGIEMQEFISALDSDLKLAQKKYPATLFLWETTAPLPAYFRALARKKSMAGEGQWTKGGWPLPRIPFDGPGKGILRRGFILTDR